MENSDPVLMNQSKTFLDSKVRWTEDYSMVRRAASPENQLPGQGGGAWQGMLHSAGVSAACSHERKRKGECPAGKCSLPACLHRGSGRCSPSTALPSNSQKGGCWVSNLESQCVFSRQGLWGPCLESWTQSQGLWTWVFQVQRGEEKLSAPWWSTSPSSECMAGPQGRPVPLCSPEALNELLLLLLLGAASW